MRVAAVAHDLAHSHARRRRPALRQQGHLAGEVAGRQCRGGRTVGQQNIARLGGVQSRDRTQQGGLAAAVGAHQGGDPASGQLDSSAVDDPIAAIAQIQIDSAERNLGPDHER
jgi:hypothetical protein